MKKLTALALSAMLSVSVLAQAERVVGAPQHTGAKADDLFSYVITSPAEGAESFYSVQLQFPQAAELSFVPSWSEWSTYVSFKMNGKSFAPQYAYHSIGDTDNSINLDLGGFQASVDDRWEVKIEPGLFALYDADENKLGENPLMEIVVTEGQPMSKVDFSFSTEPASSDPYDTSMLVTGLSEVKLTFPKLDTVTAAADAAEITLGGATVDKSAYTVTTSGTDNVVKLVFSPELVSDEDAPLSISFAEKSLTGKKGDVTDVNLTKVECNYYTVVPAVKYDLTIDFDSPKPDADGNINLSKFKSILFFTCDDSSVKAAGGTTPNFTLKEVNGDFETSVKLSVINGYAPGKSAFQAMFAECPVYNGEYTLTLDKGSIGDTRWRLDHSMGHTNDELVLRFNIIGGEERPASPHIDLSVAFAATEVLAVKGVPSEEDIYWYASLVEAEGCPDDAALLEASLDFFKTGAALFGMDWVTVYQMTAKTGEYTWGFGDLNPSTDYVAFAFGLDNEGALYMPLTRIVVRTADPVVSDNTFSLEVLSVEDGTADETKKVTLKITPTNDDKYTAVIYDKYLGDDYKFDDEASHKSFLRSVLRPMVSSERLYSGEQTVVFDNVKIDAVMQAAVFGFESYETTLSTRADFSTVDDNFEAVVVMAYEPGITGASASIFSFDMERPFIAGVISKADAEALGGIDKVHEEYNVPMWVSAGMGYYDWRMFARRDLKRQALDGPLSDIISASALRWDTEYYVYGYLMDEGGYRTSPVFYDSFTTASRNQTDNSFELTLDGVTSNEPYSSETFTAEMTIVPSDKEAPYALYYGDTFDFESYLEEGRLEDWMYDVFMRRRVKRTYSGDLEFGYGMVEEGRNYILIVAGFDEAPNTAPTWMLFNKDGVYGNSWSGISEVAGNKLLVNAIGRDIYLAGEYTEAAVYSVSGLKAGVFRNGVCSVEAPGCYIVRVQTATGVETHKVVVK